MKLSPRDILIAAIVGIVVVAVILVVVLVLPQNRNLKEIDAQIAQAQDQIGQAESLLARRQEAKNRAAMTANELIKLSNAVPETPELPSLIIELQDTATESGLQFRSLTPGQPVQAWQPQGKQPQATYLKIPMKMQVFGTWADTVDFLQRVNKLPRQLRVTGVDVVSVGTQLPANVPSPPPTVPILSEVGIEAYMIPSATDPASTGTSQ